MKKNTGISLKRPKKVKKGQENNKTFYDIFIFNLTPIFKSLKFVYNPMIYICCSTAIHILELGLPVASILL